VLAVPILRCVSVSSANTEVCECLKKKQFHVDKSALISKKKSDVNMSAKLQGPEKSHATE